MFRLYYILLFIFIFSGVSAQVDVLQSDEPPQILPLQDTVFVHEENDSIKIQRVIDQNDVSNESEIEQEYKFLDTTETREIRETRDTVNRGRILEQWTFTRDFSAEKPIVFDTLFSLFNRYRIIDSYSPVNAFIGNYGLPYYPINFFDRITDPDMFLYSGLYHFMHTSDNATFMNLHVPFTELKWTIGGKRETAEQTFRVKHSQNVNSKFNFGLIFDIIFNLGQYTQQRAEDKTFTFFTSYRGNRYKFYFSTGINNLSGQENGGITSKDVLDVNNSDLRNVRVNLEKSNNAGSVLRNRNFLVVQRLTLFGKQPDRDVLPVVNTKAQSVSGTISHIFQFDNTKRKYSDVGAGKFYDSIFINTQKTFDTLSAVIMKNTLRVDFTADVTKSLRYVLGFGVRNENFWFKQIIPGLELNAPDTAAWDRGTNVLLGRFSNNIGKKISWTVDGELFTDRYRQGDYILNGVITKSFGFNKGDLDLNFTGKISNRTPAFWYNQWGGNNFKWNNDFNKELRTEFGSTIAYPARNFDFRFNFAIINNYLDFNTLALPSQYDGNITVMSAAVRKDFNLWKFHFVPDVNIQKSSNTEILDLPLATIRTAAYLDHMFYFKSTNGRLYTQFGADVVYHTLYHAYSYMPATGRFYRQSTAEVGNYPFVNIFLNLKVQRTRFFFLFDHANYGIMGPNVLYNYEMIPLYPWNIRRFTFGLAWTFYN